jgi:hypothetical protein
VRNVLLMITLIGTSLVVAAAINKNTGPDSAFLTSGPSVTIDDLVDASTGRVPQFCVDAVLRTEASLPPRIRRDPYLAANARHYAEHECIQGITGESPN